MPIGEPTPCAKSTTRAQASRCPVFHSPVSAAVMRPSAETAVASAMTSP